LGGRRVAVLLGSVIIALLAGAAISVPLVTSSAPYSMYNNGPRGYSALASMASRIVWGPGLSGVSDKDYVLLVAATKPLGNESLKNLVEWVETGGELIVLDEHGYANRLFDELGLGLRVRDVAVYDVLSNDGSRLDPVAVVRVSGEAIRVVFHTVSLVEVNSSVEVLASTSPLSYADIDGDGYYSFVDRLGPFPLVAMAGHNGSVIVIPDLDVFANKYIGMYNNTGFLKTLLAGRKLAIYAQALNASSNDYLKYRYYSLFRSLGVSSTSLSLYALIVLAVVVVSRYES